MQYSCYFCPILTQIGVCLQFMLTLLNIIFHENPFSGSRVASFMGTEGVDGVQLAGVPRFCEQGK
jgi:hypothetical protein